MYIEDLVVLLHVWLKKPSLQIQGDVQKVDNFLVDSNKVQSQAICPEDELIREEEERQQQQQQQDAQQHQNQQQPGIQNRRRNSRRRARARNPNCNCRGGPQNCPLGGKCLYEKDIVYVGKVTRLDNFEEKRYTGVHEGPFKTRYYGHRGNIRNRDQKGTRLSRHIWTLKDNQPYPVPFELEWDILGKVKPFNPVTGVCRLCRLEAYIPQWGRTRFFWISGLAKVKHRVLYTKVSAKLPHLTI